tara:strand:- start:62 stop:1354 length:1293 start_codon:yes stop_codon:yes gene_type:complete
MAGKLTYKILKNKPKYDSYSQYYYYEGTDFDNFDNTDFLEGSGINTILTGDDIYTIITDEGNSSAQLDWRPISNVFIGNPNIPDSGVFLQKYYEFGTTDYIRTSAPNNVNLYFDIALNDNSFDINFDNYYNNRTGDIYFKVLNWDWKEGDLEYSNDFIDSCNLDCISVYQADQNTPNVLTHQYDTSGLKIIKVAVFSIDSSGGIRWKYVDVRIFLGLDGIFIEDFIDMGGPDFTYLPWPVTSPVIGGISEESDYFQSVEGIVNSNPFEDNEKFERYFAEKAYNNDQLGKSLGDSDIEQVRYFKNGTTDMNYLLGITNIMLPNDDFYPHTDIYDEVTDTGYWGRETNTFPKETSVGSLFIDEWVDLTLNKNCLFEINCGNIDISSIIDTSGNGNRAILIGDYKIVKDTPGIKSSRDSVIRLPEEDDKNGAI